MNIHSGDEAQKLRVLTRAEMTAVVGGQLFACESHCSDYKTLFDVKTSTGVVFGEGGVIWAFKDGKLVGGTNPEATKPRPA